jgi:uncharacterized protein (DUF433 family)
MYLDDYEAEEGQKIFEAYVSGENETELCNEYGINYDDLEEIIRIESKIRN